MPAYYCSPFYFIRDDGRFVKPHVPDGHYSEIASLRMKAHLLEQELTAERESSLQTAEVLAQSHVAHVRDLAGIAELQKRVQKLEDTVHIARSDRDAMLERVKALDQACECFQAASEQACIDASVAEKIVDNVRRILKSHAHDKEDKLRAIRTLVGDD